MRAKDTYRLSGEVICLTLICIELGGCGSSSTAASMSADAGANLDSLGTGPCGPNTLKAGTFDMTFEGVTYSKNIVHLPKGYDGSKRTPLVLNWHGLTSNASQQEAFSGMDAVADAQGFVLVYPNSPSMSWNAGTCCDFTAPSRNDVGFAMALVKKIQSETCIDAKRIYTTGMSNGAFMSYALGCEHADVFAAIAPVAGKVGVKSCAPSRPVPLMAFHGTADPLVAYYTGALSADNLGVPDTVQKWAAQDECSGATDPVGLQMDDGGSEGGPGTLIESDAGATDAGGGPAVTYQMGTVTCQTYSGCKGGATVTLCSALGEGHCWPGTAYCPYGAFTTDIDASQQIAAFFAKFSLP
jgi:polyhydroxybutyrate depolymerase